MAARCRSPAHLERLVRDGRPDAVVCVDVEEPRALRGLAPLCVVERDRLLRVFRWRR